MSAYETIRCDVLVAGAGGAGLRAALEASAAGARTTVACKSLLGKAATVLDREGIAAALGNSDAKDDWRVHFRDTMRGGALCNDWRMALAHAQEAPARVRELEGWGALFDRSAEGSILQHRAEGHRHPRVVHAGERTGLELLRTLQHQVVQRGVDVHMECSIQRVLTAGGRVCGAFGYRRTTGALVLFRCKAVILATGGDDRVRVDTAASDCSGDGISLALDAGAELADMDLASSRGVRVDADSASTAVPGLFAAGELVAGPHGAQRIAGNAHSAALVFGRRAGLHAAMHAAAEAAVEVDLKQVDACRQALLAPFERTGTESAYAVLRDLQACMRSQAPSLQDVLTLRQRVQRVAVRPIRAFNPAWHLVLELRSMLLCAQSAILAAIERESAGADDCVVLRMAGDMLAAAREPRCEMPPELKRLIHWSKAWLNRKPASVSGAATPAAANSRRIA